MKPCMGNRTTTLCSIILVAAPVLTSAMDFGGATPEIRNDIYPGKTYSPYAQRAFPSQG